ncbi:hypothetical protein GQ457_13G019470 [Hibiscus cannabinus]
MSSSPQKSASPNRQLKNNALRRYSSGANYVSKQNENLAYNPSIIHGGGGGGLLFAPPPSLSFSYNPSAPLLNPLSYQNYQQQLQPPILPLPVPLPCRTRSLSYSSPSDVKNNRRKDPIPKRSKSKKPVEEPKKRQVKPTEATKTQAVNKYKPSAFGQVPNATPNPKVGKDLDKYTGSIFTLSPPPSSLPLPSFSLRPKLSCNAEAASADDVRRILRLP